MQTGIYNPLLAYTSWFSVLIIESLNYIFVILFSKKVVK